MLAILINCACGCGQTLLNRNKHGNKRKYIYGHSATRKWLKKETPPFSLKAGTEECKDPKHAARSRELKWTRKMACLRHYSPNLVPCCACCDETEPVFLAIDHENGGGNKHRAKIGSKGGYSFYLWLVRSKFPKGFRVMCHNCNMAISILGYCPHHPPKIG